MVFWFWLTSAMSGAGLAAYIGLASDTSSILVKSLLLAGWLVPHITSLRLMKRVQAAPKKSE